MDAFAALADPGRREIVALVARKGQLPAGEIASQFAVSAQAISQHLKILREASVLTMERRAQQRLYALNPATVSSVQEWARNITNLWERRYAALSELIQEEKDGTK